MGGDGRIKLDQEKLSLGRFQSFSFSLSEELLQIDGIGRRLIMNLNLTKVLLKIVTLTSPDVENAIKYSKTCEEINEVIRVVWENPNSWHTKVGARDVATLTDTDWNHILWFAVEGCKKLGGEFDDPTGLVAVYRARSS